ncbi:seC61beta family domain-containing protein [Purpureocillium lilacinum]|uniref:SeC61beta family domain-containing protein n=1 Tax=Purpureocillium lilacinum TaxID=33203 RepID=A0A179GES4_PURLI|nr:seC61beta family domain-containing protein [Purpureocillium lilacinum]OAQ76018.1 seC61beta family domain-containing protein [Purpureocillium lilacinum]OAQ83168.1 seC61beta family domain-containing protein [Purpureocillium lilacinum]
MVCSSPRPSSPVNSPAAASGASVGRPSSPTPPGGARTAIRRRAAADQKEKIANARPTSTRAAGAGGSSSTMLSMYWLYTDESPGLKVDPVIVLVLSLVFIFSVVALHCQAHPAVLELSEERKRNGGCFERDEPAVGCVSLGKPSPELGLRTMVEGQRASS